MWVRLFYESRMKRSASDAVVVCFDTQRVSLCREQQKHGVHATLHSRDESKMALFGNFDPLGGSMCLLLSGDSVGVIDSVCSP